MTSQQVPAARTFALVVGVEKYAAGAAWDVDGPATDARRFVDWLLRSQVPDDNILLFLSPLDHNRGLLDQDGPRAQDATREMISRAITTSLRQQEGEYLLVYWAGHGVITSDGTRRLFYADATGENLLNLDLNSLLVSLRTDWLPFRRQLCLIDACATCVGSRDLPFSLPGETFPTGQPSPARQQLVLLGAKAGDLAEVKSKEKTCMFSREALALLRQANEYPQDSARLIQQLQERFRFLRASGETGQTPTYFWHRDWDGGEGSLGRPTADEPPTVSTHRLPSVGEYLFGRRDELALLDQYWDNPGINVVSFVAFGGVGKSALVRHWLGRMAQENYRGAQRVFAWSFYTQGTAAEESADQFIDTALRWFDDSAPTTAESPFEKSERLARLIRRQCTLLILDGLEPLQYPPGPNAGRLKDPALATLLRQLAASNPGLCVITTRTEVADLAAEKTSTAPCEILKTLSEEAGAALLKELGVMGPDSELRQASGDFGGHALALTLLGTYLRDAFHGDVRRRAEVSLLEQDAAEGGHAQRVLASYEKWLGEGLELAIVRLIGMFNRPADRESLQALRKAPVISGLTDALIGLSDPQWNQAVSRLRKARLLASKEPGQPDALDAHPLVREYFGLNLRTKHPQAWREGHNRLYEHLKGAAKSFPDNIQEMAPLYAAVIHGCQACRHQDALDVYFRRIQREKQDFNTMKLGANVADLAVLSGFFDIPWSQPVASLRDVDEKPYALSAASSNLRALGRMTEAIQSCQEALSIDDAQKTVWNCLAAANDAAILSELYLYTGHLSRSLEYARGAQERTALASTYRGSFSRREVEKQLGYRRRTDSAVLANTLHQMGRLSEAEQAFASAEKEQKQIEPQFQFLYGLQHFWYGGLLLSKGNYQEVLERAFKAIEVASVWGWPIDFAVSHLSLGEAQLVRAQREATDDYGEATKYLGRSVDLLRQKGPVEILPGALLARAELRRLTGDLEGMRADLDEALAVAAQAAMSLYQADCHLASCRGRLAAGAFGKARESLAEAAETIQRTGYHRRDADRLLLSARLHLAEGRKDDAKRDLAAAREIIDKTGYHLLDHEVRDLSEKLREP